MILPQLTLVIAVATILVTLNRVRKWREIDGFDLLILTLASFSILLAVVVIK